MFLHNTGLVELIKTASTFFLSLSLNIVDVCKFRLIFDPDPVFPFRIQKDRIVTFKKPAFNLTGVPDLVRTGSATLLIHCTLPTLASWKEDVYLENL